MTDAELTLACARVYAAAYAAPTALGAASRRLYAKEAVVAFVQTMSELTEDARAKKDD